MSMHIIALDDMIRLPHFIAFRDVGTVTLPPRAVPARSTFEHAGTGAKSELGVVSALLRAGVVRAPEQCQAPHSPNQVERNSGDKARADAYH